MKKAFYVWIALGMLTIGGIIGGLLWERGKEARTQKRLDEMYEKMYMVTAPDLTEKEQIAKEIVRQWLTQNTSLMPELSEGMADVFIRCERNNQCSESASIVSVALKEQSKLWRSYIVKSSHGETFEMVIDNSAAAKEVHFVYQDNQLIYASSIP